ncbi:DHA2 family efflux MFS transporter permease subunit [Candidatus Trichorickettsia mobilis]|uniref:DHA2 family efflux MFS transporter permease subunit n=1 Tax=Candidatus Trichorickettsia mobilis TaxID=1346319 RepID=UPI0029301D3B|nr:DHA2 family efflux MFS transporter permease subunit [Candidatus Trichorickettsia mobilis]
MTALATTPPPLSRKQLWAFFAMIVGMFMAVLDIQIVASSLSVIAAGLSASPDELSWVQTSYLIAEVIIIPITGFIARLLSTRISYFIAAVGFTIMSVLCSLAWNIESMIIFRSLQGFFGGAMIPTVFSTVFIIFPPKQRSTVTIIIGLVVTMAPTLGPTLGGYITEIFSWHFMFLLNLLPGIFVCTMVFLYADFDQPNYNLLKNFDYFGIILMAISLGALQYVLEEGNKCGWFDDYKILLLSIMVFCGFIGLIIRELTFINPILDLTAFHNRNFTLGCIYSFMLGMGLYNAIYLLPLFLFSIAEYNTIQIGQTMMITGMAQFVSAPIAGRMVAMGVDHRLVLAIGLFMFGSGCYLDSFLTPDSRFEEFVVPQLFRGMALMFCFIPVNDIALGTMARDQIQNASGLYNLTRNLGGAIGLAVVNSLLTTKSKIYEQYLEEHLSTTSSNVITKLNILQKFLAGKVADPELAAYIMLKKTIAINAFVIAINDMFALIGLLFFVSAILLPFTANIQNKDMEISGH